MTVRVTPVSITNGPVAFAFSSASIVVLAVNVCAFTLKIDVSILFAVVRNFVAVMFPANFHQPMR